MKKGTTRLKFILLITLFLLTFYGISKSTLVQDAIADPESLRSFILSLGILAPLGIILLQMFQTTISIVPSQLTTILAGFIFGPFLGLLYSLIGAIIGSMIIFSVGRKYGRKIAGLFFDEAELLHFTLFFKEKKLLALFLARLAPIFPNDLVSFTAGLTQIKVWHFNLISTAGFVVQMILLTYFGAELSTGELSVPLLSISLVISLLLMLFLFKEDVHKILIGDFRLLQKERKIIKDRIAKELRKIRL
ncbi:TVP38/TMEM64 family protein [Candidatus Woesearchaeota archaeon]|nr:TVP38/TMEM64 family protein [Candidatus Woesearchaeota archaeon]